MYTHKTKYYQKKYIKNFKMENKSTTHKVYNFISLTYSHTCVCTYIYDKNKHF